MIGRISGQYSAEALNRKKSRPNVSYNSGSFNETDNANISSFGSLLAKATAEMKNIPDVRADVVADFLTIPRWTSWLMFSTWPEC